MYAPFPGRPFLKRNSAEPMQRSACEQAIDQRRRSDRAVDAEWIARYSPQPPRGAVSTRAQMEMQKPGPELRKLDNFVAAWTSDGVSSRDPRPVWINNLHTCILLSS